VVWVSQGLTKEEVKLLMFYSFVTISIVVGLCSLLGKIVTQKLLNPVFCSEKRGFFYGEKFMSNSLLMQNNSL
ncbi:hypothetical protein, partial [Vibrio cholerae]